MATATAKFNEISGKMVEKVFKTGSDKEYKTLSDNDLTDELKGRYDSAYNHSTEDHAPASAQENVIEKVNVNGTALSVTDKAVDVSIPTKVSELENDEGYLKHQSLETYYTKAETTERLNQKQDTLDKYVESVNGYSGEVNLSASDVHALPDTTVIPTVPSVVSAFVNDADYADRKYVAEVAAGKCKAYTFETVTELDEWLAVEENTTGLNNGDVFYIREVGVPDYWWDKDTQSKQILETTKVDLTDYAKKDSIPQKVSQLTNDAGYTTASEVDTKLGEKQDKLTEYASSVNGKSGNVVLNSSDVGALPADTFIPSKMSELNDDKGYALKSEIPTIPSSLPANGGNANTVNGIGLRIVTDINDPGQQGYLTVII